MTIQAASSDVRIVEDAGEWDTIIRGLPEGNLLQSHGWGQFKGFFGWKPERFIATVSTGSAAAQVLWRSTPLGPIGYVPRGPVMPSANNVAAAKALADGIHQSARWRKAIFLKVEPNNAESDPWRSLGFRASHETFQPHATLKLDLDVGLETLSKQQHSKTRYNTRLAAKKGVLVRIGNEDDLPLFHKLVDETGQRDGFAVRSLGYLRDLLIHFGENATLLLAEHEGDLLAGIIVVRFGNEAIYLYGASGGVKRNLMPTYLLQWEAITQAQKVGLSYYDFWGVPGEVADDAAEVDEDQLPLARKHERGDLWGVYRFKRGFGGRLQSYCGAYDYVYNPAAYYLWTKAVPLARRLLRRSQGID